MVVQCQVVVLGRRYVHRQLPASKHKHISSIRNQKKSLYKNSPHRSRLHPTCYRTCILCLQHPKFKAPTYMYGIELNGCVAHMHLSLTNDKYKPQRQKHRTVEFNAGNIINYNMTVIESEQLCMWAWTVIAIIMQIVCCRVYANPVHPVFLLHFAADDP